MTSPITPAVIGVTALSVAQSVGLVAAFNPSILDVQTYDETRAGGNIKKSVRTGMLFGGAIGVTLGVGASLATKSWWPLIGSVLGLFVIGAAYEWALKHQGEA